MECPRCGSSSKVEETRVDAAGRPRRYRRCAKCHQRFTTVEVLDVGSISVSKRTGDNEPFSRSKLTRSIEKATIAELPASEVNEAVNRVIHTLTLDEVGSTPQTATTLRSTEIGEAVMRVLRSEPKLEAVHVRYALLFEPARGSFGNADSFLEWLRQERLSSKPSVGREPELVVKRSGSIEGFDLAKLQRSIRFAAKKRPEEVEKGDDVRLGVLLANNVLDGVRYQRIVTSGQLATEMMRALRSKPEDPELARLLSDGERELAYLRVASTAKHFSRGADFAAEALGLIQFRPVQTG